MAAIDHLWCKIAKTAVGAIFNVNHCILEVILGIAPLHIQSDVIGLKHYLKAITVDSGSNIHMDFITSGVEDRNPDVMGHIKRLFKFLRWKIDMVPDECSESDRTIIMELRYHQTMLLSPQCCRYS